MIGYLKMVRVITGAWESTERPRAHTGRGNRDRRGEILLYSSHNCIRLIEQCHEINFECLGEEEGLILNILEILYNFNGLPVFRSA